MEEIFKYIKDPVLIVLALMVILQFKVIGMCVKVILKFMDITEKNGKNIQELTTWLKSREE